MILLFITFNSISWPVPAATLPASRYMVTNRRTVKLPSGPVRLRICRVKCSECGATHAILLASMVPYSQIPLSDQQRICSDYEEGRCISSVCETNPSIDENNAKSVLRNYRRCWREKLRSLRIRLFPLESLICSCFSDYSSQFMQIHRQANRLFPIPHNLTRQGSCCLLQ